MNLQSVKSYNRTLPPSESQTYRRKTDLAANTIRCQENTAMHLNEYTHVCMYASRLLHQIRFLSGLTHVHINMYSIYNSAIYDMYTSFQTYCQNNFYLFQQENVTKGRPIESRAENHSRRDLHPAKLDEPADITRFHQMGMWVSTK